MSLVAALLLIHSWYPQDCCGGNASVGDCRPVPCESLSEDQNGIRYRDHYLELQFSGPQIRPSQDAQCHVCANRLQPYCVFVRPES